jgi:hypothetical protein
MRYFTFFCAIYLMAITLVAAQTKRGTITPASGSPVRFSVLAGSSIEFSGQSTATSIPTGGGFVELETGLLTAGIPIAIERPLRPHVMLGFHFTPLLRNDLDPFFTSAMSADSYEAGLYAHYFLHTPLSGRLSPVFFGGSLRLGSRRYVFDRNFTFTPFPLRTLESATARSTQFLIHAGTRFYFGHAFVECLLPFGLKNMRLGANDFILQDFNGLHFVMSPAVHIGYSISGPGTENRLKNKK